jgi:hypothetical protein
MEAADRPATVTAACVVLDVLAASPLVMMIGEVAAGQPPGLLAAAVLTSAHGHMRAADLIIVLVGIVGAAVLLSLPRSRPSFRRAPSVTPTG